MNPFTKLTARVVVLPIDDVDTDQIIPARFLKATDKEGMGARLFADWRYNADGSPRPEFILNQPASQGAQVLLAGHNFGCGSSREHAPWALAGFGFRAVVATSFADIFRNNSLKNGLLPVILEPAAHQKMVEMFEELPAAQVIIDLASQILTLPDGSTATFPIDSFSRTCLLNGVDELGYILKMEDRIAEYENKNRIRADFQPPMTGQA
jgi:3-isopropylmalate/(R)-2-methylmalate dehydratase small subunit